MRYYLYVLRNGAWHLSYIFANEGSLIYHCSAFQEDIKNRLSMNGNDLRCVPDIYWDNDGHMYQTYSYRLRDILVMDEQSHIIDPRLFMKKLSKCDGAGAVDEGTYKRRRWYRKSGKSSWGCRRLRHYKRDLKDTSWEKCENHGCRVKQKHRSPNAWDLEPVRRNSACWKDQTKRARQYKQKSEPIGSDF